MSIDAILDSITSVEEEHDLTRYLIARHPDIARTAIQQLAYRAIPADAVHLIAEVYGYTAQEVAGSGRQREGREIAQCRATVIDILNHPNIFGIGRPSIGERFLGGRDNSTVRYIQKHHFVLDLKYMAALHRTCLLMKLDYHAMLASMERIHGCDLTTNVS